VIVIPGDISIRKANERDRPALEAYFEELQSFELSLELNRAEPVLIRRLYIDRMYAACERTGGAIFVAEVARRVIGFVSVLSEVESEDIIERDRCHAYVTDLVVGSAHRRIGVASKLMQVAEAHARSSGARRIRVGVLAANSGAHELYRRLGYKDREVVLEKTLEGMTDSR
jgi:GNAT superfamily N-acetyltransferase